MRYLWIMMLSTYLFTTLPSEAETISEQLKAADSTFRIKYKNKEVTILDQKITLRAVANREELETSDSVKTVTAAGYRAYHLEIAYLGRHIDTPYAIERAEFYNDKDEMIYETDLQVRIRAMAESARGKNIDIRYMSINLENIPLVLLNDVVSIEFKQ